MNPTPTLPLACSARWRSQRSAWPYDPYVPSKALHQLSMVIRRASVGLQNERCESATLYVSTNARHDVSGGWQRAHAIALARCGLQWIPGIKKPLH